MSFKISLRLRNILSSTDIFFLLSSASHMEVPFHSCGSPVNITKFSKKKRMLKKQHLKATEGKFIRFTTIYLDLQQFI
tara:strand:- start:60 stop:293 length:234 start_codon:yes stop_codon:yes gene_type:complete